MAYNTGYADLQSSQGHKHLPQEFHTVSESPEFGVRSDVHSHSKRLRIDSPPLFGSPDPFPVSHSIDVVPGQETKKLIVSTCRTIVKLEMTFTNLETKLCTLEQHRLNGTVPKDLSLPKKKSLFEHEQSLKWMKSYKKLQVLFLYKGWVKFLGKSLKLSFTRHP